MTGRSPVIGWVGIGGPPSRAAPARQGSGLLHPFPAVRPAPNSGARPLPCPPAASTRAARLRASLVEQVEAAVVGQRRVAPLAVGDQHVAREVGRIGAGRKQDRLARVVGAAGEAVRQEARRRPGPTASGRAGRDRPRPRRRSAAARRRRGFLGEAGDHLLGRACRRAGRNRPARQLPTQASSTSATYWSSSRTPKPVAPLS